MAADRRWRGESASELRAAIVTAIVMWPKRVDKLWLHFALFSEKFADFKSHFATSFPRLRANVSDTELKEHWHALGKIAPRYTDWWRQILLGYGLTFEFADAEPRIGVDALERWEHALDHLDADAMVSLALAARQETTDIEREVRSLRNWNTIVQVSDRELVTLWRSGISDMHIHVGGVRFAHAVWFDLMDGDADLSGYKSLASQSGLFARMPKAIEARDKLWRHLGGRPSDDLPQSGDDQWWRWRKDRLRGERLLLARCWRDLDKDDALADLDQYLFAKSLFMSATRQPIEGGPGLDFFHDYTKRLKEHAGRDTRSARLFMQPFGDALMFLGESPHLRRAELRFDPGVLPVELSRVAQWFGEMVTAFNTQRTTQTNAPPPIDARLAFHFKRSRDLHGGSAPIEALLSRIDRQSAALRLALNDPHLSAPLRQWLARIDIAGQERNTSIVEMAPYLRLAVGDDELLRRLRKFNDKDPRRAQFRHWLEVVAQNKAYASPEEARLGVTIHAGEDYSDPISGIHEVASAVEFLKLGPGDGIGHGLALTVDAEDFLRERGAHAMIARGTHIDSIAWLSELIETSGFPDGHKYQYQLAHSAEEEAAQIFGQRVSIKEIAWLRRARATLEMPDKNTLDANRWRLWKRHTSEYLRAKRDELIPLPPIHWQCSEIVTWAQRQIIEEIKRRRIIIELNPSSNVRVSGATSIALSPTIKLLIMSESGLRVSVNTDNPGTFLSRVENEYAHLLLGCRQSDIPEWQTRALLERARETGMTAVYWPERPSGSLGEDSH